MRPAFPGTQAATSLFYVEVNLRSRAILRDFTAVEQHVERVDVRPLDAADGFCGFLHRVLGSLRKTLIGSPHYFNDFLSHKLLLNATGDSTPRTVSSAVRDLRAEAGLLKQGEGHARCVAF